MLILGPSVIAVADPDAGGLNGASASKVVTALVVGLEPIHQVHKIERGCVSHESPTETKETPSAHHHRALRHRGYRAHLRKAHKAGDGSDRQGAGSSYKERRFRSSKVMMQPNLYCVKCIITVSGGGQDRPGSN